MMADAEVVDAGVEMIDTTEKDLTTDLTIEAARDIDRALISKAEQARIEDAKLERRIRMAMAAKEDSAGNCFYCGRRLDVERDDAGNEVKLHPMPYLECKGATPPNARLSQSGRVERTVDAVSIKPARLPELRPVVRPFGERD